MLKIIAIGLTGVMTSVCMLAFYAFQTGIAVVNVHDKVHGKHLFVPVPVGLVNLGLNIVPGEMFRQVRDDLGPHRKMIQSLANELENVPDTDFVDVQSKQKRVLISKSGRNLIIDVQTPEESVYVRFPIRATGSIVAKLASFKEAD
ncbi:hypothetical protein L0222_30240 [bacterium]|nr:hypothetical protein [bacterium]